ncbi:MAG: DEAD/DEAH box helicase [Campylobacterota bacterium]|nr:DEAD/DEAH box helicase [Campylobacterota bacterium]
MSFHTLGLNSELIKAVTQKGYKNPTQVQQKVIPSILKNLDIFATAQTGSGKSAAFLLPMLHNLNKSEKSAKFAHPRAVILAPTKELAHQLQKSVNEYSAFLDIRSTLLIGGKNISAQQKELASGRVDIVVATPGRLRDHTKLKNIVLASVQFLVLDEADTLLDMGFLEEIDDILALLPITRQNLMFSATKSGKVMNLSQKILRSNERVEIDSIGTTALSLEQLVYEVDVEKKLELLPYIIGSNNYKKVLVFVSTKAEAETIKKELNSSGLKSETLHGDKKQGARTKILNSFRESQIKVLVATDIAARGIDITDLNVVINFDLPQVPDDYIHRVGRTARAGSSGVAISLVSFEEKGYLANIEKMLKKRLEKRVEEGFEPISIVKRREIKRSEMNKKSTNTTSYAPTKTSGAFGKKKAKSGAKSKKTTKRDY